MRSETDPSPPCLSRSPAQRGHHVPPSGRFLACRRTVSLGHQESFATGYLGAVQPVTGRDRSGQSFGIHQGLTSRPHALSLLPHQRVSGASCRVHRLAQTLSAQRMADFSSTSRCLD